MSRRAKYTDSDIIEAVRVVMTGGGKLSPHKVQQQLGGGNIKRITAVIKLAAGEISASTETTIPMPFPLSDEIKEASQQMAAQMLVVAQKCWSIACGSETVMSAKSEKMLISFKELERNFLASSIRVAQLESDQNEKVLALKESGQLVAELNQQCSNFKEALRGAESDLRAAQKIAESYERNQRHDRDEISRLHSKIENLVAERAALEVQVGAINASRNFAVRSKG
ncbi:MAG: DNA-binding protein [Pseudomonadota bacterium]